MSRASRAVLSVATLNTHGSLPFSSRHPIKQLQITCGAFEWLPLGVINLQEVWSYRLLEILEKNLPSYPYHAYTPGLLGPKAGLVTFSRIPFTTSRFIDFPPIDEPKKKRLLNRFKRALKKKGVQVSCVPQRGLIICNAYLVANGDGDWSARSRYYPAHVHDIDLLARVVNTLASTEEQTLLLTGDFNIPKCSDLYLRFVEQTSAMDVFGNDDTPTFHQEYLPPGKQAHCIDYIFLCADKGQLLAKKAALLFTEKVMMDGESFYLSDHVGLVAELDGLPPRA